MEKENLAEVSCVSIVKNTDNYIALLITNVEFPCWRFVCPCGVEVNYPLNELPEVNTRFPCDNENHWVIKFSKGL